MAPQNPPSPARKKRRGPRYAIEPLEMAPTLHMEDFMQLAQTNRLDSQTAAELTRRLDVWADKLHGRRIDAGGVEALLVWLDETVEQEIDACWSSAPSHAFMLGALAQAVLMAAVRQYVPEASAGGCAPVPAPNRALEKALEEAGVAWTHEHSLARQYAMLTHMPYIGGCEVCHLQPRCPKLMFAGGAGESAGGEASPQG